MDHAIVIGYPGIGKSTLANKNYKYIDLESSAFWIDGKRPVHWFIPYVNEAIHLASQGHVVFISSHAPVRNYLSTVKLPNSVKCIYICYPALKLRSAWIEMLKMRYLYTNSEKDHTAWTTVERDFSNNIETMMRTRWNKIVIESMDYKLEELLENVK